MDPVALTGSKLKHIDRKYFQTPPMIPWGGSCIQPTDRSAIHTAASTHRYSRPTNQLLNLENARA